MYQIGKYSTHLQEMKKEKNAEKQFSVILYMLRKLFSSPKWLLVCVKGNVLQGGKMKNV